MVSIVTEKSQDYISKMWQRFNNIDRSYDTFIRNIHDKCLRKVLERCNTVDSFSSSFAANVNIIAKWKYSYVHLILGYRFSNSNAKVCTIAFKMNTRKCETKKCEREIISDYMRTANHITRLPELWTEASPRYIIS